MKYIAVIFLFLVTALTFSAPPIEVEKPIADVSGHYRVRGENGDGTSYGGLATINKVNNVYIVRYVSGNTISTGVGYRKGDTVVFGWSANKGEVTGLTTYAIKGRNLDGFALMLPGPGVPQREKLSWLGDLGGNDDDEEDSK